MSYSLTVKAEEDIINIFVDGARNFSIKQAENYHTSIYQAFELLDKNPKLATQRFEINPPIRIYPFKSHLIVYLINESNNLLIVRVCHQKEDWINNPIA